MSRAALVAIALGTLVALSLLMLSRPPEKFRSTAAVRQSDDTPPQEAALFATAPPAFDPALNDLNRPSADIQTDLRIVHGILDRYRLIVKDHGSDPLGDNREIVRALQGRNRAGIAFLPQRHPTLNDRGEWMDRWGTPYFFHALAHDRMEIRSAGPDQKFWTSDDAVYPPHRYMYDYPISLPTSAGAGRLPVP